MAALADYAEFPFVDGRPATPDTVPSPTDPRTMRSATGVLYNLRKGMAWQEVRTALGDPESTSERMEGRLKVTTASFAHDDQRIEAEFVEGVLIKYAISSK
jgi:hypothetical protein